MPPARTAIGQIFKIKIGGYSHSQTLLILKTLQSDGNPISGPLGLVAGDCDCESPAVLNLVIGSNFALSIFFKLNH